MQRKPHHLAVSRRVVIFRQFVDGDEDALGNQFIGEMTSIGDAIDWIRREQYCLELQGCSAEPISSLAPDGYGYAIQEPYRHDGVTPKQWNLLAMTRECQAGYFTHAPPEVGGYRLKPDEVPPVRKKSRSYRYLISGIGQLRDRDASRR